ncbi:MAG: response regulator receiver sensor signal transduction histidine kinase [Chloroflexi bacterium OLB15]|nr:MAG: response regulator receiver sensor signal transduction histidine kinase [Chloroflexi bacterium OLB15]
MTETPEVRTILYIEDDPASRTLVERTLRYAGYRVLVAERGILGIDIARKEFPDLILLDINLPDLTGREIATTLRADPKFDRTPIVALTAQGMREQRNMSMAAGFNGYLTKPLDVEHLPSQLEFYLGGGHDETDAAAITEGQSRYVKEVVIRLEKRIRELEAYNADLSRLDSLKDAFINIAAHELRTPLTLLIGYNRLLLENPYVKSMLADDDGARMLTDGMAQSIARMQSIINEILTISRIITNRLELSVAPVSIAETIQRAMAFYSTTLSERKLKVEVNTVGAPSRMLADWELMELTLRNLLGNAIKYTPDGGTVTISVTADPGEGPEDTTVRISVKDTGIGIPIDSLDRIFERFNTTSDPMLHSTSKTSFRGGGIGLGLAVAKGIVEAHGGRIWAESAGFDPERCPGSEFIIVMPLMAMSRRGVTGGLTSITSKI